MLDSIYTLGAIAMFFAEIIKTAGRAPWPRAEIFYQIWRVTVQSIATTGVAGFFVGAIMVIQFSLQMSEFGALGYLGGLATSGTVREVGPLLIAFMLSGKVGAFTSAELGTMKVTEQLDAIRCLGSDPMREIVLPRFVAIVVSSFFLLGLGLLMSILGGILLGRIFSGVEFEEYVRYIPSIVTKVSVVSGMIKCLVFAALIALICTYRGYTTTGGAKGVGLAVVRTSVGTMLAIVVADWFTSFLFDVITEYFGT